MDKVSADIKKNLKASVSTINNVLKSKIKSHGDKVTDFCVENIPKVDSNYIYLAVISLENLTEIWTSLFTIGFRREKKIVRHINEWFLLF